MKIKKQIKEHYNSVPIPMAEKVLPNEIKTELMYRLPKTSARWTLKLATVIICVVVITVSLIAGLNKTSDNIPITNISENELQEGDGFVSDTIGNTDNNSSQTDISDSVTNNSGSVGEAHPDISDEMGESVEPDTSEQPIGKEDDELTVYTTVSAGEFAGDMYRPEGYDEKIGSVLAIKMSMNESEETRFNVLVQTYDMIDVYELLVQTIGSVDVVTIEIDGQFAGKAYYVYVTEVEINKLTSYGLKCHYIGSGLGDIKDMNWETEEGINTYCEIWGDMYTFNNRGVSHEPDFYIED